MCSRWAVALAVSVAAAGCPVRAGASAAVAAIQTRATSTNQAAWQAFHRRDFSECERLAREAWQLAEADGDSVQSTFAAANLAAAVALRGRLDEALEWSRRARKGVDVSCRASRSTSSRFWPATAGSLISTTVTAG